MATVDRIVEKALKYPPRYLFRYQPFKKDRLVSILLGSVLYATSPSKFNDPEDTVVKFDESGTKTEWTERLHKLFQERDPSMPDFEREIRVKAAIDNGVYEELGKSSAHIFRNESGIICMTESPCCRMMWKEYAQNHKGVCFRFNHSIYEKFFGRAIPVEYTDDYPMYRYVDVKLGDVIVELMITKKVKWKYENERRIIILGQPNSIQPFDPSLLSGVVLGYKVNKNDTRFVKCLIQKRKLKIPVYRAVMNKCDSGMHLVMV